MESLITLFCTAGLLLAGGLYWFICIVLMRKDEKRSAMDISGGSISHDKFQDTYNQYWSFFKSPKEIQQTDEVPAFVDTFYNLVTDIYEWAWGQSFQFYPEIHGKSQKEVSRIHEEMAVDLLNVKPGEDHRVLDVGCGVGGPMRTIAAHSHVNVVGITINSYQAKRAQVYNKKAGLDSLCEVVCGNFLQMPFPDNSFDGAYSIAATCHAHNLEEVYSEIFRVLKPGSLYVSYEWATTDMFDSENPEHVEIILGIERGDAIPGLRSYDQISEVAKKVGFEVVKEKDLAKPPAKPWWTGLKLGRIGHWRSLMVVTILSWLGITPKGTVDVHEMLYVTTRYLIRGGETGIFTPMHMILCRKPES